MNSPGKWGRLQWLSAVVVLAFTAFMAVRQLQFVDRYALNILFWDQWDLYTPIFRHSSWWTLFTFQHGPHRQGVGFLITPILARISGCNTRWDAFAISTAMIVSTLLGLFLSLLCGVRQPISLLAVPLIHLSIRQMESFVGASNLSHGAMPILMLNALCLAWFIKHDSTRLAILSLLTFGLIFTGFGLFVGLLTPVPLFAELLDARRQNDRRHAALVLLALAACAASWALFFINYHFDPANPDFHFPYEKPFEYFDFVALMLANFYGVDPNGRLAVPLGFILMAILCGICGYHLTGLIRRGALRERNSVVVFLLSAYGLTFCFVTAVGRVSMNWRWAALQSRYVTLMIPAAMAIFLQLATLRRSFLAVSFSLIYATLMLSGSLQLPPADWGHVHAICKAKADWRDAYLADRSAPEHRSFQIYPRPGEIKNRLKFIEMHHLNFFEGAPAQSKPR